MTRSAALRGALAAAALSLGGSALGSAVELSPLAPLPLLLARARAEVAPAQGFSAVAKRTIPSVVAIQIKKRAARPAPGEGGGFEEEFLRHFFGYGGRGGHGGRGPAPRGPEEAEGQGSGFIVSEDGYILTNNHVVGGADEIEVKLEDGRALPATLVGADEKSDVAVIKVEARGLPALKTGDSEHLEIGDWVIAVGNPFGLSATLTVGVVSAKGRANMGITDYEDFIQSDAAINPGNSGGPLLNIGGEVVGINTAIYSRSGGYMGIGFAIPIQMALKIKDQLISYGEVRRSKMGVLIQELTREVAERLGASERGALIAEVLPDSPAEAAGLKAGDVVLKMGAHALESSADFRNRVALTPPGERLSLLVLRDGKERVIEVEVEAMEGAARPGARAPQGGAPAGASALGDLGFDGQAVTPDLARKLRLRRVVGVLITDVTRGGAAARAGLAAGQVILSVNQRDVSDVESLSREIKRSGDAALLRVWSEEGVRFVVLSR